MLNEDKMMELINEQQQQILEFLMERKQKKKPNEVKETKQTKKKNEETKCKEKIWKAILEFTSQILKRQSD